MTNINLRNEPISSCTITYSREGYKPSAVVVGDHTRIETTVFQDNSQSTPIDHRDNPPLSKQWDTLSEPTESQKDTDQSKTSFFSRYAVDWDLSLIHI